MLHNLIGYADTHHISGDEGFSSKRIRFLFLFSPEGEYLRLYDYGKQGEDFSGVPHIQFTGDVPTRQFLVDTLEYLILFSQDTDSFRKAVVRLMSDLEEETDFPVVEQFIKRCLDLLDEGDYREFSQIVDKEKWKEVLQNEDREIKPKIHFFLSPDGPLEKFYESEELKLILAKNNLKKATEKLLLDLSREADFNEIEKASKEAMLLLEDKKYLDVRERKTKENWLKILKQKKRGQRKDVKDFIGPDGPVNGIFNNGSFKRISKHQFCTRLLQEASESAPVFQHIVVALTNPTVRKQIIRDLYACSPTPTDSNNATFAVVDDVKWKVLVEQSFWHNWWKSKYPDLTENKSSQFARCFLSGELTNPILTHPKIKGLGGVGGKSETSLVSFDKGSASFQSYGFTQGENAAISAETAVKYASSINSLLKTQHKLLAGAEVVYWYSGEIESDEDILHSMLGDFGGFVGDADEEDEVQLEAQANIKAKKFLKSVSEGKRRHLKDIRYYALTLQGNQGRAVIQNWMDGSFLQLAKNVEQWFADLEVPRLSGKGTAKLPKFETLITCLLKEPKKSQKYADWIKPVTGFRDSLWRAALGGRSIKLPENSARLALLRIRESTLTDEWENAIAQEGEKTGMRRARLYARIGLIKAYLTRNRKEEIDMSKPNQIQDSVYWIGRLFAVLADLQRSAHQSDGGDVRSTIVDRFYSTATTCPKLVFGKLITHSQHHIRKLENSNSEKDQKAAAAIKNEIADICNRIKLELLPELLSLPEQSWFALGYFQQIAVVNQRKAEAKAKKPVRTTMESTDE